MKSGAYTGFRIRTTGSCFLAASMDVTVPCILKSTGLIMSIWCFCGVRLYIWGQAFSTSSAGWVSSTHDGSALPQTCSCLFALRCTIEAWQRLNGSLHLLSSRAWRLIVWEVTMLPVAVCSIGLPLIGNPHYHRHTSPSYGLLTSSLINAS